MNTWRQDLGFARRTLAKNSRVSGMVILTLALGIGVNTAMFSVANAVLLRRLPFKKPGRLVMVWLRNLPRGYKLMQVSAPDFLDFRKQNQVFENMSAFCGGILDLTGHGEPQQVFGAYVSASFFSVLGVRAELGRTFLPGEDQPGRDHVALISSGLWQRRYGSDPSLLGNGVTLNGTVYTVVGITPRWLRFSPDFDQQGNPSSLQPDVWIPLDLSTKYLGAYDITDRGLFLLGVLARLKPDSTANAAQSNLETINRQIQQDYPIIRDWNVVVVPLAKQLEGDARPALLVLLGAVGFVLLIACANAANLLLARAAARQKEIAIRAALGASRLRIVRQLLTESVLLALVGGVLGLALAYCFTPLLVAAAANIIPQVDGASVDAQALVYTLLISILTGIIFGLAPALQASRPDLMETLKETGGRATDSVHRRRARSLLAICEIALALVLLIATGLMIRTFLHLLSVNPGFNPRNVLTLQIRRNPVKYPDASQRAAFFQQVLDQVTTLPGAQATGGVDILPMTGGTWTWTFNTEAQPGLPAAQRPIANYHTVSPGFFTTLRIPFLKGRNFSQTDTLENPKVTIISASLARRIFPNENPLGKRINFVDPPGKPVWRQIVGVVGDVRYGSLNSEPGLDVYSPYLQPYAAFPTGTMILVIRTTVAPDSMANSVRYALESIDKDQPVYDVKPLDQYLSESLAKQRLYMLLLDMFSAVALMLAGLGIYGVISYSVTQRTHEIALRMAMGAQRGDILRLVLGQGMLLAVTGIGAGVAASLAATRVMGSLLYGVRLTDPLVYLGVSLLLAIVTLLACYIPARRATHVEPMMALRNE
ncbi:MAG: ABC transporter permease [Terriglobia bacterium]